MANKAIDMLKKECMNNATSRVVCITGASSGIGAALGEYYAQSGTTLALLARDEIELKSVSEKCRAKGAVVHEYLADVTDLVAMRKCVADLLSRVEGVDIVIANAGIRGEEDVDCQDTQIAEETMRVNYFGVINTFSPFIRPMKARGRGQLAVISSIASFRGTPNSGAYSASKAAVNVWTESLRLRLIPHGIGLTTICMGFVNTAMTAGLPFWMPGILSAEQAAALIAKSIEKKMRVVTLPWQSRFIWSVFRIMPGMLYDKLIIWAKAHGPKR
jgi:short-subunit dehydrogenase